MEQTAIVHLLLLVRKSVKLVLELLELIVLLHLLVLHLFDLHIFQVVLVLVVRQVFLRDLSNVSGGA
jgi:hypothetical protein